MQPETKKGIWAVGFFTLAAIVTLSLFSLGGVAGEYLTKIFSLVFGWGIFFLPFLFIVAGIILVKSYDIQLSYIGRLLGVTLLTFTLLGLLHIFTDPEQASLLAKTGKGGGYVGLAVSYPLLKTLSFWGTLVVLAAGVVISFLIIFNVSLANLISRDQEEEDVTKGKKPATYLGGLKENKKAVEKPLLPAELSAKFGLKDRISVMAKKVMSSEAKDSDVMKKTETANSYKQFEANINYNKDENWMPLPLDLLEKEKSGAESGNIKANTEIIRQTLENFGISVEMGDVNVGPTVTQYTLRPEGGIKLSRIAALNNDLSLALAAHPIRIETPIPGKPLVGIEIPNYKVATVRLRNVLESEGFKNRRSPLTIALGRDVSNNIITADLDKMPHLLISGSTGSGKSVCINDIIISLIYANSPSNLKLLLVDPKRVELSVYDGIPHLIAPVVVKPDKTVNALKWCVSEMEKRYELLSEIGARDIISYNSQVSSKDIKGGGEEILSPIPYIVVIIDELADLMATHGREMEAAIVRLAQMARAVGIHLIVATQRPSTEVITGLIKANITSRVAFRVASQIDSRTILDMAGAEKLLGNGDMLFVSGESSKPKRIQGAFVSENEVKKLAEFLKKNNHAEVAEESQEDIFQSNTLASISIDDASSEDELYKEAKDVVIKAGKASASLLQRRLRVGYARAARLLDLLEDNGVIGPAEGARPRQVFVDEGARVDYSKIEHKEEKDEEIL